MMKFSIDLLVQDLKYEDPLAYFGSTLKSL